MTNPRFAILLVCLGAMLACFLVWQILSLPPPVNARVAVVFVGITNDAAGMRTAHFQCTNGCQRDIGFAAGPIEIHGDSARLLCCRPVASGRWPESLYALAGSAVLGDFLAHEALVFH